MPHQWGLDFLPSNLPRTPASGGYWWPQAPNVIEKNYVGANGPARGELHMAISCKNARATQ
jgi:hypothetical protein